MGQIKVHWAEFLWVAFLSTNAMTLSPGPPGPCGQTHYLLEDDDVVITSPNYPSNYENNLKCQWIIEKSAKILNFSVSVTFTDFHTEKHWDTMSAGHGLDPNDAATTVIKDHSGNDVTGLDFVSTSEGVWISFNSDSGGNEKGFMAEITIASSATTALPTTTERPISTVITTTTNNPTTENTRTFRSLTIETATTVNPKTVYPTTKFSTTDNPTTVNPKTVYPTSIFSTTDNPTTVNPKTLNPTSILSTTDNPTTVNPKTVNPTSIVPATEYPTTKIISTTVIPTTDRENPTTLILTRPHTTQTIGNPTTVVTTTMDIPTKPWPDGPTSRIQTTTQISTDNRKTVHSTTVIPTKTVHLTKAIPTSGNPSTVISTSGSSTEIIPTNRSPTTVIPTTRHSPIVSPTEPADQCGQSYYFLEDDKVTVTSPNYPDNYPSNIECQWVVEKKGSKNILVTFTDFNTEKNSDLLNAGQGLNPSNDSTVVFQDESGSDIQGFDFLSTSSGIWITFKSDNSGTDRGFSVELVLTDKTTSSMNYTLEVEGNLKTPHWPDRTYLPNTEIQWLLRATSGLHVLLEFIDFNLQKDSISTDPLKSCPHDYDTVKIYDGTSTSSPIAGVFCGSEIPAVIELSGQHMLVVFKSDGYIEDRGFSANFSSLGPEATEKSGGDAEVQTESWIWALVGICILIIIVSIGLIAYDLSERKKARAIAPDVHEENIETSELEHINIKDENLNF